MLSLLLDEMNSRVVPEQSDRWRPDIPVTSVFTWRGGACAGVDDDIVLRAAYEESLTLVTYDCTTIPPVLIEWFDLGISHAGIIFIDERTISTADFCGLIRALSALWDAERDSDWTDRTVYLSAAR